MSFDRKLERKESRGARSQTPAAVAEVRVPEPPAAEPIRSIQPEAREPSEAGAAPAAITSSGDLTISENVAVHESIAARGKVRIGRGARIDGSVTCTDGMEVCEGARVRSIEVSGTLRWENGAEADRVSLRGALVTDDGRVRVTGLVARGGIHTGTPKGLSSREGR